jgi:internalin A
MLDGPVARPWRRFLHFSVRRLIVLVLVIGAGLGWLVRSARIQREAVAAITRAGGVKYKYGWTYGDYQPGVKPLRPGWLADRIGVDFFANVTDVRLFWSSQSINQAIVQVGRLNRVERLTVHQFSVSDVRVAQLKGLTNVSELTLDAVQCTDAGLVQLTELTNLSKLDLSATEVTDAGLTEMQRLTKLSELVLMATRVTDAGLVHLKGLRNLTKLDVSGTRVSDAGLRQLKGLSNLSELTLYSTQVTPRGVKEIKQALPRLTVGYY